MLTPTYNFLGKGGIGVIAFVFSASVLIHSCVIFKPKYLKYFLKNQKFSNLTVKLAFRNKEKTSVSNLKCSCSSYVTAIRMISYR